MRGESSYDVEEVDRVDDDDAHENLAVMRAQDNLECLPASHMSKSIEHLLLFKAS